MPLLSCEPSQPRVFLGTRATLDAVIDLKERNVVQILYVGLGENSPSDAPIACACSTLDTRLDGNLLSVQLARAAELLQEALHKAKTSPLKPTYDLEPGLSSDEEGGSNEGTRLRVRVSRGADDKWGIKWHKTMFKQSNRLVVDEVAEGSIIDTWNSFQPSHLQVRYGDRLVRINGVRMDQASQAQITAKMRAELQKEEMRALFWRPGACGSVDEDPISKSAMSPAGTVLVCSENSVVDAAAVVVAYSMLHNSGKTPRSLTDALESLGDVSQVLRQLEAEPLLAGLRELESLDCKVELLENDIKMPMDSASNSNAMTGQCEPRSGLGVSISASEEATLAVDTPQADAVDTPQSEALAVESGSTQTAACTISEKQLEWTYCCRKCGAALFHENSVVPHEEEGIANIARNWSKAGEEAGCTSVFVEPMSWMGNLEEQTGKILCGNVRCRQKLGGYSWHGLPCSCGQWQSPAFQIHSARIDCMPAARRLRGPPPKPTFAG